ncbi:MAG: DUF116 domain-containing protein [Planctomycetota bacterium]|nr:DUF116 domain-containing protein [Planctomycetota bacterium]
MEEESSGSAGGDPGPDLRVRIAAATKEFISDKVSHRSPSEFRPLQQQLAAYLVEKFAPPHIDDNDLEYRDTGHYARDVGTVMLFNYLNLVELAKTERDKRAIFFPECLTAKRKCEAEEYDRYLRCSHCGKCSVHWTLEVAREYGFEEENTFIVPGGSGMPAIVRTHDIQAVVGLACYHELYAYLDAFSGRGVPPSQMIMLTRWGCRNTRFSREQAREVFESIAEVERELAD